MMQLVAGILHVLTARGVGFSPDFLCLGGWAFELEKFSAVFKEKMQEFLDLFQRNWRQPEKQAFLCCCISIFAKAVDV